MITVQTEVTEFGTIQHCEMSNRTHAQCFAQAAREAGCEVEMHTTKAGAHWVEFYASEDVFVAVNRAAENAFFELMEPEAAPVAMRRTAKTPRSRLAFRRFGLSITHFGPALLNDVLRHHFQGEAD